MAESVRGAGDEGLTLTLGDDGPPSASGRLFLCHNSADKNIIRDVAEAVELEYGVQNFLDVYSIAAGANFIEAIQAELAGCSGCAIFLGEKGWGPTHFWEAEQAVARYRTDPAFKLIPVVLPGANDTDKDRLAGGSVFRDLNWVDFSSSPSDVDNVRKLYGALTGASDENLARRGLTPFILRRDARRWRERRGQDRSQLYSGAKLREAQALLVSAVDLLDVREVAAFLDAGARRQRRFWQWLAGSSSVAAAVLLVLASIAWIQAEIATQRQAVATSRMLAIGAGDARGADRQLLQAVAAVTVRSTPEARSALLGRLTQWSALVAMRHLPDREFTAADFDSENRTLVLGAADGGVWHVPVELPADASRIGEIALGPARLVSARTGEGAASALIVSAKSAAIVGYQSGRVDRLTADGGVLTLRASPAAEQGYDGAVKDRAVLAFAIAPKRDRIAVGDARGWIEILPLDEGDSFRPLTLDRRDEMRITALTFVADDVLALGTGTAVVEIVDLRTHRTIDIAPRQDGEIKALSFRPESQQLMAVADQGVMRTFALDANRNLVMIGPGTNRAEAPPLMVGASIAPKSGRIALAYGDGVMEHRDNAGSALLERSQPHRDLIGMFAFIEGYDLVASAGRDGMVALWSRHDRLQVIGSFAHFPGLVDQIAVDIDDSLLVLRKEERAVTISRLANGAWQTVLDLILSSHEAAPDSSLEPSREPGRGGFVDISTEAIPNLQIGAGLALWSTHGGLVLSQRWSDPSATIRSTADGKITALALAGNGSLGAALIAERNARLFSLTGKEASTAPDINLTEDAAAIALSHDARYLAVGTERGQLILYDLTLPSAPPVVREVLDGSASAITFAPDGRSLLMLSTTSGRQRRALAAVDLRDLRSVSYLPIPERMTGGLSALAISPDSGVLAASDHGGNVLLWELSQYRSIGWLSVDGAQISSLAFRSDGALIATRSTGENVVRVDFSTTALMSLACRLVAREISIEEWDDLATGLAYRPMCFRK